MKEITLKIVNPSGLHARPAAMFVQEAKKYPCTIEVEKDGRVIDGKSLLNILTLQATFGSKITLRANGEKEEEVIEALGKLVNSGLGEL